MDYSKAIKAYRKKHKMSQAKFAELINSYSSTICHYESGRMSPGKQMAERINSVLYAMKSKEYPLKRIHSIKTFEPIEPKIIIQPVEIVYDELNKLIKLTNMRHMDDDKDTKVFSVLTVKYNDKDHLHRFIKDNVASAEESLLTRAIA